MGLQSALSTALTGLTAAETQISVIGNNLANSNTVGFKASRATFSTQFMQTMSLGAAPNENSGGANPRQIGLGTMVAGVTPDFSQGTLETSANPTDLAIQGDGFFIVEGGSGERLYTRNGIFNMNAEGQLLTITGNRVLGYGIDDEFQIQRTVLTPLGISLGVSSVAEATENAYLEGTLKPAGEDVFVADTAERIQTGVLGDGQYTRPTTKLSTDQAPQLIVNGVPPVSGAGANPGAFPAVTFQDGVYQYRFVYANRTYTGASNLDEAVPSDAVSVDLAGTDYDQIDLSNVPISDPSPAGSYEYVRVYRTAADGNDFYYVDEMPIAAGPTTGYTDTLDDATLLTRSQLDMDALTASNSYAYYVTFADAAGGPGIGTESRPSPISASIVPNGRVALHDLPTADPADGWAVRRIYRSVGGTFYYVGETADATSDVSLTDNRTDADISDPTNPTFGTINLDGPGILPTTLLTSVLHRDGSSYSPILEEGTLRFTGRKFSVKLAAQEFEITSTSTVQDLIDFMVGALGIQEPSADPLNPIPPDSVSGANPGGMVTTDGRILLTANNGLGNAIAITPGDVSLVTAAGTVGDVNLDFGSIQTAVGESAMTNFIVYDSLGIPLNTRLTAVMESRDSSSTTYRWFADSQDNDPALGSQIGVGTGLITFDGQGRFVTASESTVSIDRQTVSSTSPMSFELDFSGINGLAAESSSLAVSRQDGSAPGELTAFVVDENGIIRGSFSNGVTRDLGQLRLARFANSTALEQKGENLFAEGVNSGLPVEGDPGQQGLGTIRAGAVELSNTDVGASLIDLIMASTMYRGNTRVITTAQQMIDELLALRR